MTAKDLKNALLQEAVQGKLVPQIASEGNARDLLEEIRKERLSYGLDFANAKSGKKSKKETALAGSNPCDIPEDEIPFDIPESWCWCRLGDVFQTISGTTPQSKNPLYYDNGTIGWVRTTDLNNGILSKAEILITEKAKLDCNLKMIPKNSVCMALYGGGGTIGKNALLNFETTINQSVCALLPNKFADMKYLQFFLQWQRPHWMDYASGSRKDPNINQIIVKNCPFPLPPLAEQKRIVAAIEKFMPLIEEYDKKETVLNELNAQIGTLTKKAILQEAVQGKLVPPACRQAGKSPAKGLIKPEENWYFVYVIECKDGSFYKGFTENLEKRLEEHKRGIGADWTKTHGVKQLYYWEKVYTKEAAIKREKYLKSGIGREWFKKEVVEKPENWLDGHELLAKIRQQKQELIKEGNIKKDKAKASASGRTLPEITEDEIPCLPTGRPFDIPENWCWCRLGEIVNKLTDGTHRTPKYVEKGIPFLSVKNLSSGKMDFENTKFITPEEHKELYARCNPEKGDMLLTKVGTTGIPVINDSDIEFSLFVSVALLKFSHEYINEKYFLYLLQSPLVQEQAQENTKGVGNKNWVMDAIAKTVLVLPPLSEQKRIVAAIEQLLSLCEKLGK